MDGDSLQNHLVPATVMIKSDFPLTLSKIEVCCEGTGFFSITSMKIAP